MNGKPIEQAKKAIERGLTSLQKGDTFQLIRFSNDSSQFGPRPVDATPDNVRRAISHLRGLSGQGGTQMIEGIKAALDFPHDERRVRVVAFLTDGYIGNEAQILGEVYKRLGATRVFSFGVGSSPNRYLLERMAKLGRGAVAYVGLNDDGAKVMGLFFDRISHPAMTDISIDWGRMKVSEVYANAAPELFVGRPLILTGRFEGEGTAAVKVSGTVAGKPQEMALTVDLDDAAATHKGIPFVWARTKIADMSDRATYDSEQDWPVRIRTLALEYGLMSAYTAFVAVDSLTVTEGDHGVTVQVPVPVPDGVRYETTVQDAAMGG
jgi:Ca-activated chloride channel family protein